MHKYMLIIYTVLIINFNIVIDQYDILFLNAHNIIVIFILKESCFLNHTFKPSKAPIQALSRIL